MDMDPDEGVRPGLVRTNAPTLAAKVHDPSTPPEEIFALERALAFRADFVYFRRVPDRPPVPLAWVFDRTDTLSSSITSGEMAQLHRRLWSAGEIPLSFVFLPTEVQIYHVLQGPRLADGDMEAHPWDTVRLAGEVAQALGELASKYSARRLDDGRFWEETPAAGRLGPDGAAFMALLTEVGERRAELGGSCDPALVNRLLILFILIKYLEERRDKNRQGVFPPSAFSDFVEGASGFLDILEAGPEAVLRFLDALARPDRLNGEVFKLNAGERKALSETDLRPFSDLLGGQYSGTQRTLWPRYSFHDLPVELISHLYEQFLPRQPGVVYTPPFLVNFILDEVLPLSESTPDGFRLLDPACGSGIFLVGAFKRLVQRWRWEHAYEPPDVDTLKRLQRECLCGVDCQPEAVRLTQFSLAIALCDFLEPRVIWNELHFDDLVGTNLFHDDFFARARSAEWEDSKPFHVVVGNPPFVEVLTPAGQTWCKRLKTEEGFELPGKQAALLFLKAATQITKSNGQIALVQPSGPLLYNENSAVFREPFFEKTHIPQIVDLTHLSRVLFKRRKPGTPSRESEANSRANPGDEPVAVVFAENRPPTQDLLLHVTVRRTVQAEQKLMFEVDHYDLHFVPRHDAIHDPRVWKADFIGGGRIPALLRRLGGLPSLGQYLEEKRREGWDWGEGYIAGSDKKISRMRELKGRPDGSLSEAETRELAALKKRHRRAPWLTEKRLLPTRAFTAHGVAWEKLQTITSEYFTEPRRESLFQGPLVLIKEVIESDTGAIPVALVENGVCYLDQVFGIHAPSAVLMELDCLKRAMESRLVRFSVTSTSPKYLVARSSAFRQADILKVPYSPNSDDLVLTPIEEAIVDDVLTYVAEFKRKGDKSAVMHPPTDTDLRAFGEFFCRVLGTVYPPLRAGTPVVFKGGICFPFHFGGPSAPLPAAEGCDGDSIQALLEQEVGSSLRCQRILRVFHGDTLLLVKPPQLRYWLRSIAVRDADEIFADLLADGN